MCLYTHSLFFLGWRLHPTGARQGRSSQRHFSLSQYPSDALPISGLGNGDLLLKGINADDDGLYQCTVANHVGYSVCVVEVKVSGRYSSPKNSLAWGWVGWGGGGGGPGLDSRYLNSILELQLVASPPLSGSTLPTPTPRPPPRLEQLEATYRFI